MRYAHFSRIEESRGFTLIELAIVLIVVALLLAGLIGTLRTQLEARDRQRAIDDLEEIKEAMLGYAVAEGRLPCPDTDGDGIENPVPPLPPLPVPPPVCAGPEGNVPYATLGVVADDPWRTTQQRWPYRYRVTTLFADYGAAGPGLPGSACPSPPQRASFNLCDNGDITINDGANVIAQQVPAVIWSRGSNRNEADKQIGGTASNDETQNENGDATFTAKQFSREDNQEFDDIVTWIPLGVLQNRMIQAGFLP